MLRCEGYCVDHDVDMVFPRMPSGQEAYSPALREPCPLASVWKSTNAAPVQPRFLPFLTHFLSVLALSKRNSNAAEIILFLHRLVQVLIEYFKELEEESIRDNFVIIYELMDEMMDFGYPQTTESKILQECVHALVSYPLLLLIELCRYITQESYKLEVQVRPPIAVTNAVSWRSEGIRYRKNEVFLDVIESVNLLVNANGNVVRSEILGAVKMKCYLSGMPELRLGLNDKVMFESTGRSMSYSMSWWSCAHVVLQTHEERRSRWKTSNSTSVCASRASRTTARSRSSHPTASLNSCRTVSLHPSSRSSGSRPRCVAPSHRYPSQELIRLAGGAPQGQQDRVHGESQGAIQAPQYGEQRRDLRARARRCGHTQVPGKGLV